MDTLPARDSLTPFISWSLEDPDKINCPLSSELSTINLMFSNMPGSFCTSSIKRGHGLFKKNNFGSSCACRRVKTSSKLAIVYAGNVSFMTVDFPSCLAPVSKVHLLVSTRFFRIGVIALGIYFIWFLRLI